MLIIRKEQMDAFQQHAEETFIHSIFEQLQSSHADAVPNVPAEKVYKRIAYGIEKARAYGLTWQNNITTFVALMFTVAPDFDNHPAFHRYLTDERVEPDKRIGMLLKKITDSDWNKARESLGRAHWPEEML
ncbi:MAG: hypothetical protein ACMUIA_01100 [bacterium]